MDILQGSLWAKLVFSDIAETPKPAQILRPMAISTLKCSNSLGALSVVCSATHPPSAYAAASQINS